MLDESKAAEAKARIIREQGTTITKLLDEACKLAEGRYTPARSFDSLVDVAERFSKAVTPYLPCRDGCSHCCYMAVSIGEFEARMISRHTGRKLAVKGTVEKFLNTADENIIKYTGVPCTFLGADGKCTVYAVRPIACRTHHNLMPTAENCIIKDTPNPENTLKLNVIEIDSAAVTLTMFSGYGFADIREYFPKEVL